MRDEVDFDFLTLIGYVPKDYVSVHALIRFWHQQRSSIAATAYSESSYIDYKTFHNDSDFSKAAVPDQGSKATSGLLPDLYRSNLHHDWLVGLFGNDFEVLGCFV